MKLVLHSNKALVPIYTISSLSIGLGHDGDNNCSNGVNIMATAVPGGPGALKWSSCSRDVLQAFLRFVMI